MPTRMVTYLRERTVYVAVLVEGPRRRRSNSTNNKFHHYQHQHLHVRHVANGGGYNRKAQLLDYSRHLRASNQSKPSTPLVPQQVQRQNSQIVAVKNKPKYVSVPACMGNWKFVMPRFLRSFMTQNKKSKKKKNMASKTNKIKAIVKSFQTVKKTFESYVLNQRFKESLAYSPKFFLHYGRVIDEQTITPESKNQGIRRFIDEQTEE